MTSRGLIILSLLAIQAIVLPDDCAAQRNISGEGIMAGQPVNGSPSIKGGLLFYLSGNNGFTADVSAGGQREPNFLKHVSMISHGASGQGFRAEDDQLLTYWAPGNIYAQRGTIAFFWRSGYPIGHTPFPIFRVSYADHTSWDMVWLRIDFNGSGFDAFVTDIGLSRTRVSYFPDRLPGPGEWTHFALSWDETEGIRFYINGMLAANKSSGQTLFDAGLDQFGPHSRIISPYQVQSAYSFMRGGDIDEIQIYDRMLSDNAVELISKGKSLPWMPDLIRDLSDRKWRDEWWLRNGWNLPNMPPPELPAVTTSVHKVEIHDAVDIKRWYWKANDGIRETTWPGVYNMSRLPGRYDYFVLPDWDCYSGSGQSVKFMIPDEKWNHIEIWGKAWGQLTFESDSGYDFTFGLRTQNQMKSVHRLETSLQGGRIRFDNALIEEPVGSFDVFNVEKGTTPRGTFQETYTLSYAPEVFSDETLDEIASFIRGRYPADEQVMMLASKESTITRLKSRSPSANALPFIHVLVPYTVYSDKGLDGIEIMLPVMNVKPTHNGLYPMNIRIKDPIWVIRDLADFSFSVRPGIAPSIWMDTRDRILPANHSLYLTISGAGTGLTPELLIGTKIKLVYKDKETAGKEHVIDRFTQIRDLYAHIIEERPKSSKLNLYNRFMADCNDLLSVKPDHWLGKTYKYALTGQDKPSCKIADIPAGIPEWAFLQTEYMRFLERLVTYYIDNRQIANGEFGGGLSDDGDLTNMWPGLSFLGIDPDKILSSLRLHMSAYYDQERDPGDAGLRQRSLPLFTNGLATIFTDELHALEDGIQVVGQLQLLDYGNPVHIERAMETTLRLMNDITGINKAGHWHFRSRYYGGTRIAVEDPWQWSVNRSYHILHPAYLLAYHNGNPGVRQMIIDLANGLMAHKHNDEIYTDIKFDTDSDRVDTGIAAGNIPWHLMYAAYMMTGDEKYIEGGPDSNSEKRIFDKKLIAELYRSEITNLAINEYINTEGSIWIDRISSFNPIIQKDRLGGVALTRTNVLYPQHRVSWKFAKPENFDDVAIFIPDTKKTEIKVIAYNVENIPVEGTMTVWDVIPGKWKIIKGIDTNEDQIIERTESSEIIQIDRGSTISLTFTPGNYHIFQLELIEPSGKYYSLLPDLAISLNDVKINKGEVKMMVHNIGAADSPEAKIEIRDKKGAVVGSSIVPSLEAPLDLIPRRKEVRVKIPLEIDLKGGYVIIDPDGVIEEITKNNSVIKL